MTATETLQAKFTEPTEHQKELMALIREWQEKHERTNKEVISALLVTAWTITNVTK